LYLAPVSHLTAAWPALPVDATIGKWVELASATEFGDQYTFKVSACAGYATGLCNG